MSISVKEQIQHLANRYIRHGGKRNRRQQLQRLISACDWIAQHHLISSLEQIGKRQIIDFYQQNRALSHATRMGYFYAFKELWEWMGRLGEPPRPYPVTMKQ